MESPGALPSRVLVFQLVCHFHRYQAYSSKSTVRPKMESCFQDRACSVSSFRTNNTYRKDWLSPNKEGKCRLSTLRTWSFLAITTVLGGKNLFTFIDETVSLRLSRVRAQSRPTLCNPMDCSPSGSSVHGILQARILGWVASSSSRGSSWTRDQTEFSWVSCIWGGFFFFTSELSGKPWEATYCPSFSSLRKYYFYQQKNTK